MSYALPDYLAQHANFGDCPPGHRFSLYFDGWEADWRKPTNKTPAFKTVTDAFPAHSRSALAALRARQQAHAQALNGTILIYPAKLSSPLATGLGNEHPLENGFAFLNPHGLPYLAGSGVKGVLRRAAEELATGDWGDTAGWEQTVIDVLFGLEPDSGDTDSVRTRGALVFWDLFFEPSAKKNVLTIEIMTAHHSGYLQKKGSPHANELPNPIPFLAVPAGSACTLYVQCNPAHLPGTANGLRDGWKALIEAAIEHAGEWLGFGAKTAVGYGRIGIDPAAQVARAEQAAAEQKARAEEAERQRLASLPADEQMLARLDAQLRSLPSDPRGDGRIIVQQTSTAYWPAALNLLAELSASLHALSRAEREALAIDIKKRLTVHFKIEGKAEKAMKQQLATVRGD